MGKMTPSTSTKKGKAKEVMAVQLLGDESEGEKPKKEVRRSGPSGKVVRVVLTLTKGKGKKTPNWQAKEVKSAAVVCTTDEADGVEEETLSGSKYEEKERHCSPVPKEEDNIPPVI